MAILVGKAHVRLTWDDAVEALQAISRAATCSERTDEVGRATKLMACRRLAEEALSKATVDTTDTGCCGHQRSALAKDQGAELVRAEAKPAVVDLEIGNLTVRSKTPNGFVAGWQTDVLIDGKPFPVQSLEVRIAVDEVVTAKLEYFPQVKGK